MTSNITYQKGFISPSDRHQLYGHKSAVIWLTGLSASGKSTLAYELEKEWYHEGIHSCVLDGDNLRHGLNRDLGFSTEDRSENIRRLAHAARLFVDAGLVVLVAAISPVRNARQDARQLFAEREFIEVYVKCPLEQCEVRDPKGLYKKARGAEISQFTGISSLYEPPLRPDLVVETDKHSVQECVKKIKEHAEQFISFG